MQDRIHVFGSQLVEAAYADLTGKEAPRACEIWDLGECRRIACRRSEDLKIWEEAVAVVKRKVVLPSEP